MKESRIKIGICILCILVGIFILQITKGAPDTVQEGISNEIIRFHVLANSDTELDQERKLKVRDAVVTYIQEKMENVTSKEQAEEVIMKQLPEIKKIAENTLDEQGYSENVETMLTRRTFPVKVYGDLVFPAGEYETLQVEIGEAKGRNWWCVMYPSLCLVEEGYTAVSKEGKERLESCLTEEEYESIQMEETEVEYGLKIVQIFKELWD